MPKDPAYPFVHAYTNGRDAARLEPRGLGFILPSHMVEWQLCGAWRAYLSIGPSFMPDIRGPFETGRDACRFIADLLLARIQARRRSLLSGTPLCEPCICETGHVATGAEPARMSFVLPSYVIEHKIDARWHVGMPRGPEQEPSWMRPFDSQEDACACIASQLWISVKDRRDRLLGYDGDQLLLDLAPGTQGKGPP